MDSRIFQEAVAGLSQEERSALRQMGGSELAGAAQAITAGVREQMNRLAVQADQSRPQHIRLVKP